jgi:elongation factor Tu
MNKIDAADKEMAELAEMELRELMTEVGFNGDEVPVITGSALCALEGKEDPIGRDAITKLLEAVDEKIPNPVRDLDKPYLLPIESVYSIPGRGTVVSGRLERGIIKKGAECEITGYGKQVKSIITSVEMFHKTLDEAQAGDSVGALLRGVKREDVRRGMVMGKPGSLGHHDHVEAQVYCLKKEEGGRSKPTLSTYNSVMYSRTFDCATQMVFTNKDLMMPGEDVHMTLKLMKPMVMEQGLRFTLRDGMVTLGTGVVTKVLPSLSIEERNKLAKGRTKAEKEAMKKKMEEIQEKLQSQS